MAEVDECFAQGIALEDEQRLVAESANEILNWIRGHSEANREEYEQKEKEFDSRCNLVMRRLFAVAVILEPVTHSQ